MTLTNDRARHPRCSRHASRRPAGTEIAGAPEVTEQESLRRVYQWFGEGCRHSDSVESAQAEEVWTTLLHEIRTAVRRSSSGRKKVVAPLRTEPAASALDSILRALERKRSPPNASDPSSSGDRAEGERA